MAHKATTVVPVRKERAMKIQATTTKKGPDGKTVPDRKVTFEYNVPDKLEDLVKAFGGEVVAAASQDSIVISVQAYARQMLKKGKSEADVLAAVKAWLPNIRNVVKQTAFEKAASSLDKLSPAERAELLKKLQAIK